MGVVSDVLNFDRYSNGVRVHIEDVKKQIGGAWQDVNEIYAAENGQWVLVWQRIPNENTLTALQVAKITDNPNVYGIGSVSNQGNTLSLTVYDSEYPGATPLRHMVGGKSKVFVTTKPVTVSFTVFMSGDYHAPVFGVDIAGETSYGGELYSHTFTSSAVRGSFTLGASSIKRRLVFWYAMTSSNQQEPSHQSTAYMQNLKFDDRQISF